MEFYGKTYSIAVKIAFTPDDEVLHISAEYEDCKSVSNSTGIPVREIIRKTEEKGWKLFDVPDYGLY